MYSFIPAYIHVLKHSIFLIKSQVFKHALAEISFDHFYSDLQMFSKYLNLSLSSGAPENICEIFLTIPQLCHNNILKSKPFHVALTVWLVWMLEG